MTYSYLHSGQLRYHDFQKLREIHQRRWNPSIFTKNRKINILSDGNYSNHNNSNVLPHSNLNGSRRSFWSFRSKSNVDDNISTVIDTSAVPNSPNNSNDQLLKYHEYRANANPEDAHAQYTFLAGLVQHGHHGAVVQRCTHPKFRNMAMDIHSAMLFLQCIQYTQNYVLVDVVRLIDRIEQTNNRMRNSSTNSTKHNDYLISSLVDIKQRFQQINLTKEQQVNEFMVIMSSQFPETQLPKTADSSPPSNNAEYVAPLSSAEQTIAPGVVGASASPSASANALLQQQSSNLGGIVRGADPRYPLHIQLYQPNMSGKSALLGVAGKCLLAFIVISGISVLFDEKGGISGAVGNMSSNNTSNNKHIQEADGSTMTVKFEDVKGVTEAKLELEEIVHYLKDPSKFTRLGGKLPRGLLLTGPPGTGKTLLAKAIAGEAGVPFFYSSGSQFDEVYVGLGAKRIRELFETAKQKSPSIIFIDEIDAVGGTRKQKDQSAMKMTLNELLVQLDGFEENNGIIVIGATNFADSLDEALLRPGRFDKHITVPLPDVGGRKEILEMYGRKTKLSSDVDLAVLARGTTGFSGADLYNLMNQAALKASVDGLNSITMSVLDYAKDKIVMGAERKTAVITPETAKCTAYHEAGHALVSVLTEGSQPIYKATIMPRGSALGMVSLLPEGDQTSQSYKEMVAFIDVALGGRVAEELVFGKEEVTSGAMSDIVNATKVARTMITKYGFSSKVGVVYHGGETGEESASDQTRALIDQEVKSMIHTSYERVKKLLTQHKKEHHLLAQALIEYETLSGEEVRNLIKHGIKPMRPVVNSNDGGRGDPNLITPDTKTTSSTTSTGLIGKILGKDRSSS